MIKHNEDPCGKKTVYTCKGLKGDDGAPGTPGEPGSSVTSGVTFDGTNFDCIVDALDITAGEDLNSILAKMLPKLCIAAQEPYILQEQNQSVTGIQTVGTAFTATETGRYHVRGIAHVNSFDGGATVGRYLDLGLYKYIGGSVSAYICGGDRWEQNTLSTLRTGTSFEGLVDLAAGQGVIMYCSDYGGDGPVPPTVSVTLYAKRVS